MMANLKNFLGTILIGSLVLSCSNGEADAHQTAPQETPKALQDGEYEIKSYSRSNDLIEEVYQEIVDKTPALKKLEDDLDAFRSKPNELGTKFNEYDDKSHKYYNSANAKVSTISDSILRKKIVAHIAASSKMYSQNTAELNALLKQIAKNDITLQDHHSVLKVIITLPIIEKYQADNKPGQKEFDNLIKQQEHLIMRTDSLTPKY